MRRFYNCYRLSMLLLFVISCPFEVYSQQNRSFDIEIIDSLVLINDFIKADSVLNFQIAKLKHAKLYDSLYHYPLYVGKVAALKHNSILAANRAQRFVDKLAVLTSDSRTMFRAYLNMEELYIQLGNDTKALEVSKKALEYAKSVKDIEQKELGQINYNIGFNYYALYDLSNASVYFKQSTIKNVGVDWEKTLVLNGEVGDFVTIARKERQTGNWFVGGITDENSRSMDLTFDFLEANQNYEAILYKDGEEAHWDNNPLDIDIEKMELNNKSKLSVKLAEGGGFAISLMKI